MEKRLIKMMIENLEKNESVKMWKKAKKTMREFNTSYELGLTEQEIDDLLIWLSSK